MTQIEKKCRIEHLQELMKFALLHGFNRARDFHYAVLRAIEVGNMSWTDKSAIEGLAWSALHRPDASKALTEKKAGDSHGEFKSVSQTDGKFGNMLCWSYNNEKFEDGECRFSKAGDSCKKLHACDKCAKNGFFQIHKAKYGCSKKSEN